VGRHSDDLETRFWKPCVLLGLAALCCVSSLSFGAVSALAATSYEQSASLAQGSLATPTSLAVDESTEDVLVADPGQRKVLVFEGGGSGSQIGEVGAGELFSPYSVAVDETNGDVYVSDSGLTRIVRFVRTGVSPPTYSVDPTFQSPPQGSGPGEVGSFESPIDVDPTNGDLVVADTGNLEVSRFSSSGAFVDSFDGQGSAAGPFTSLLDLTVDSSGGVYTDSGTVEPFLGNVTEGRVEKFSSAGVPEGSPGNPKGLKSARSIAFDSGSENLIVALQGESSFSQGATSSLATYHEGSLEGRVSYPGTSAGSKAVDLAVDSGATGRVYALSASSEFFGTNGVDAYEQVLVPGLTFDPPSDVRAMSAHLSGRVDPAGQLATAHFEYRIEGGDWVSTPILDVEGGEQTVSADIANLTPKKGYEARLAGAIAGHETATESIGFSTTESAPGVVTEPSTEVKEFSATIGGLINPFGLDSRYYFEYGTTTAYGQVSPAVPGVAGDDYTAHAVSRSLSGLEPDATYHYRLVGVSSAGTAFGADATFTTLALGARAPRVYEQVSPVDKGLGTIGGFGFQVAPSGDGLLFTTDTAMNIPGTQSAPKLPRYVSLRGPDGWSLKQTDPPMNPPSTGSGSSKTFRLTLAISEDLTHALVVSNIALTPGAVEGAGNLYIRDLSTGGLQFVAASPEVQGFLDFAGINPISFVGGTRDFSSIVFFSAPLIPEATTGSIYSWSNTEGLKMVSIMPDGRPNTSPANSKPTSYGCEIRMTSADTKRTIFNVYGEEQGVFVREGDARTIALSVSRVSGEPTEPQYGVPLSMSKDGSSALFASLTSVPLTPDAPAVEGDLYEYVFATDELRYLGNQEVGAPIYQAEISVSDDDGYAYYKTQSNMFVVHGGVTRRVSSYDPSKKGEGSTIVSPNGRFFAFESSLQLTAYENRDHVEVYLYEADSEHLSCASCPAGGQASTGAAELPFPEQEIGANHLPDAVSDDGTVFFDTPTRLLQADTNGMRDVYAYRAGALELISPGDAPFDAKFVDVSLGGRDVFFRTAQGLVRQDQDQIFDIYDARVGGGIASQNAAPTVSCSGEGCRAPAESAPRATEAGSRATGVQPVVKRKKARKRPRPACRRSHHGKAKKCRARGKHHKKKHRKTATRRQGR
jgi:hypothetical protein